ncbi:MAG: glycosyltransferase family 4 protein [Deltaproteobacteria bacterium]|nr:glycosyltransferase family 4 protein [Deltaproteobacteria bacterium]MBW1795965.1 glycosyltransferase family 4 protein [Deltaproteobacteria bacterium]
MIDLRLVLFFTRGVALKTWDEVGMFEREVAIYRRLQECGVQVSFVTYGDASDLRYADRFPGICILCNRWGLSPKRYERWLPLLHGWHLWRAGIYKTNQTNGADMALRAARLFRKPLIARCGYMWSSLVRSRAVGGDFGEVEVASSLERKVFTAADGVVVTTAAMKKYVIETYALPADKVHVIPNYVLNHIFTPRSDPSPNGRRICFIGRISPEKNPMGLLEAVHGLDVELVMIGDGPLREKLRAKAKHSGVNLCLIGNLPHHELARYLNKADIFVLPSPHEGHPKTLLEAMACGRPVIGTNVPGIREIIRHRETGYLCGTSPEEIRLAIQDVLADADLGARMGRNAREFVVENFALERVVETELALLQELTKGRKA